MIVFPNAKINLGLKIISKRPDGYHELETCFYPIPWKDVLEVVPSEISSFSSTGIQIPDDGPNIIEKAYQLLSEDFQLSPLSIHLHKVIPIGAGLGGGSADAAFALKLYNEIFDLGLDDEQMMKYAVRLGADCAFFIKNQPMMASGIGERLSDVQVSLQGKTILLVYPNIHISTGEAYARIIPQKNDHSIESILTEKSMNEWRDLLVNDFEKSLFLSYPVLSEIKNNLYDHGAIYASMSGSGSCMFGIFDQQPKIDFKPEYLVWSGKM